MNRQSSLLKTAAKLLVLTAPLAIAACAPARVNSASAAKAPAAAQSAQIPADLTVLPAIPNDYQPALTSWGAPDLRGIWPINDIAEMPVERPARFGDRVWKNDEELAAEGARIEQLETGYKAEEEEETIGMGHWIEYKAGNRRTSMLTSPANGKLPGFTAEGIRRNGLNRSSWVPGQTFDWVTDFDSWDRCVSRGFPASMLPFRYNNGIRIFQAPDNVTIQLEMLGTRVIPIGENPQIGEKMDHWPKDVKAWMGDSRGWWEDHNTLVVETRNIQPGASPFNMATRGVPPSNTVQMSDEATVIEKFHMVDANTITYELNFSDPVIWEAPWALRVDWTRDDTYEFFEYACHAGNVQVRNYITASRAAREEEYARGQMVEVPAASGQ